MMVVGRGFRFAKLDQSNDEDEAPFSIHNVDNDHCEVVYSNSVGHEQLFTVIETEMEKRLDNPEDIANRKVIPYAQYTIYLKDKMFTLDYGTSKPELVGGKNGITPIVLNTHLITEYYLNRDRISMIEIGKDLFDGINQLNSLDFDDMEQFVNAIMVFTNAEVDAEGLQEIQDLGAVSIKSTNQKEAKVEMLQQRLNASDTQVFYERLLSSLHQILGIPMANETGEVSSSDTGKGKMVGQGYTSAGIRAEGDETNIKSCDFKAMKTLIKICKAREKSGIKELKAKDVDNKLNRDMSENLLVKTQGLMNLLACDIPREYAIPIVNLFSDSTAVVNAMQSKFGDQVSQQNAQKTSLDTNSNTQNINKSQKQNNDITRIEQKENQGN